MIVHNLPFYNVSTFNEKVRFFADVEPLINYQYNELDIMTAHTRGYI